MEFRNAYGGGGCSSLVRRICLILLAFSIATFFVACDDDSDSGSTTTYTVAFSTGDGADTVDPQTVVEGQTATRPAEDPTKADYAFLGWVTENEGDDSFDFTQAITKDTTVYANWTDATKAVLYSEDNNQLSVKKDNFTDKMLYIPGRATYESKVYSVVAIKESGFASSSSLETVYLPQSITSIGANAFKSCAALTAIYYGGTKQEWDAIAKGDGWASGSTLLTKVVCSDGEAEVSTDDTAPTEFTVTFESGDTTVDTKIVVKRDGKVERPAKNPTLNNKAFLGWQTTKDGSTVDFDFDTQITADTTISAKWENGSVRLSYTAISGGKSVKYNSDLENIDLYVYVAGLVDDVAVIAVSDNFLNGDSAVIRIFLPQSITSIGSQAFINCAGLKGINFGGTMAAWKAMVSGNSWFSDSDSFESVKCSDGTLSRNDFT